ncbi:MAG: hypothetical protein QOI41_4446 [Myxococcales bacterium]|nr:hypothetical protein [Myxococcales bacterium]
MRAMSRTVVVIATAIASSCLAIASISACGSATPTIGFEPPPTPGGETDGGIGSSGGGFGEAGSVEAGKPGCVGLQCQQHACAGGASTTVSGVVYDPAGKNPLYNVVVYVPNAPVKDLPKGATCDSCDSLYSGSPVVTTLTDAKGKFTLQNVPDGPNIPLVIQIGKWRRQLTIANVGQCVDNPQPDHSLRFPKNTQEGDIPNIAISTGGSDSLECLLKRVGLDETEYNGGSGGAGHLHIFQGGGGGIFGGPNTSPPGPASSTGLWSSKTELANYDIVLLSCEGQETTSMNQQALVDYAAAGGRVFASHFHYSWFNSGPFGSANLATWSAGTNDLGDITSSIVTTLPNGMPFPKGVALQDWLTNVNALSGGKLNITSAKHNADVTAMHTASQPWIKAESKSAGATEYFTFNTPTTAAPAMQCGRVVYSDLHVGAASGDYQSLNTTVPTGCSSADLSPQEKALEFMLFDLSSCVVPDSQPPVPPTVGPK